MGFNLGFKGLSLTQSIQFSSILLPYKWILRRLQVMLSWRQCWVVGVWGKIWWYGHWKYCICILDVAFLPFWFYLKQFIFLICIYVNQIINLFLLIFFCRIAWSCQCLLWDTVEKEMWADNKTRDNSRKCCSAVLYCHCIWS